MEKLYFLTTAVTGGNIMVNIYTNGKYYAKLINSNGEAALYGFYYINDTKLGEIAQRGSNIYFVSSERTAFTKDELLILCDFMMSIKQNYIDNEREDEDYE